jgi:hypothetical protein
VNIGNDFVKIRRNISLRTQPANPIAGLELPVSGFRGVGFTGRFA